MNRRVTIAVAGLLMALTACSGGDAADGGDVPDDQELTPSAAPSDWEEVDLGPVTVSAPPEWQRGEDTQPTETITQTVWRAPEVDGISSGGLDVKIISKPQQSTAKNAESLAISAMAMLQAGKTEPVEIEWPDAEEAYLLEYESKLTTRPATQENPTPQPLDEPITLITRTLVLGLADGSQVQVTALSSQGADLPEQAVASTVVAPQDA